MGKSSSPSLMNTLTPKQRLVSQALGQVIHKNIGLPSKKYQGDIVAPLDPGFDQVQSLIDSYDPSAFMSGTSSALDDLLSGKPAFDLDPSVIDAYFRDSVAAPALRNYQDNILPQLNAAYAGHGAAFSTRLSQAKGKALGDINADLVAQLAQTQLAAQTTRAQLADSAANRRVQGVQLAQQQTAAPLTHATLMEQALAPFQQNKQATATANYNEWVRTRPENNPYMQLALSYIGQSQNAAYNQQPNPYAGMAIGAGVGGLTGAASGALIGSVVPGIGTGIGALIGALGGVQSGAASGYGR